jgi:hypothetical protein
MAECKHKWTRVLNENGYWIYRCTVCGSTKPA